MPDEDGFPDGKEAPIIEAYFHSVNENFLPPPDLDRPVWRLMRYERFEQLIKYQALWFARFDAMEDKEECRIPVKNLGPSADLLTSAGIPVHLAHCLGIQEVAGKAFFARVEKEKPHNLINCWYLGERVSEDMWKQYGAGSGSVAIRSRAKDVGAALSRNGGRECFANPITYIDHESDVLRMNHFLGPFFTKRRTFEFEQEMRYLLHLDWCAPKGAYVPVDLKRMIHEVRVKCAQGFDPSAVKELLRSVEVDVPVLEVQN
ncbi:MAG TPA: hypothetical protein VG015_04265 [Candidatus Dormibacteraeota bacterium]|jgi:hypothetical protein|nr:hypothetical protein [Candidatus Dormibacteraeota bacterium]